MAPRLPLTALPGAALLLVLGACNDGPVDRDGTFVGNPGKMDVAVSGVPEDLSLETADVAVVDLEWWDCDGGFEVVPVDAVLDALDGRGDAVEVPGGEFCGATLVLSQDGVTVTGQTETGTAFTLVLDPALLDLDDVVRVDETDLLWTLPLGALDPAAIDALGPDAVIGPADALALEVTAELVQTTSLYEDLDADGTVSTGDTLAATADPTLDVDPPSALSADSSGCGCASGPSGGAGWLAPLVWLLVRRRRDKRAP